MRVLLFLLGACASLAAQAPGTPVFTNTGPLDCGIRSVNTNQAQAWCYLKTVTPAIVICNSIVFVNPSPTENVRPFFTCPYSNANGDFFMVIWQVQNAAIGSNVLSFTRVVTACTAVPGAAPNCPNVPIQTGTLQ